MTSPQPPPSDFLQLVLKVFNWSTKIPIALLIAFAASCLAYLGFIFVFRVTVWVYEKYLQLPW